MVAGVALLSAASAYLCQNTLRVPRRHSPVPTDARAATIRARDGVTLAASFLQPPVATARCVLALHGITDNRSGMVPLATTLLAERYAVLLPDSRAHGESGGNLVTYGVLEKFDALDWVHWMRQQGCKQIYGLGESLGGAVLIQAAAVEPAFRAIVAEGAFSTLESVARHRVARMIPLPAPVASVGSWLIVKSTEIYARPVYGLELERVSPVADIARTKTPVLLIHGMDDERTPPSHSEALAHANSAAVLWLVPHAGHAGASRTEPQEFRRRMVAWFAGN